MVMVLAMDRRQIYLYLYMCIYLLTGRFLLSADLKLEASFLTSTAALHLGCLTCCLCECLPQSLLLPLSRRLPAGRWWCWWLQCWSWRCLDLQGGLPLLCPHMHCCVLTLYTHTQMQLNKLYIYICLISIKLSGNHSVKTYTISRLYRV